MPHRTPDRTAAPAAHPRTQPAPTATPTEAERHLADGAACAGPGPRPAFQFDREPADEPAMPHRTPDRTADAAAHPHTRPAPTATPAGPPRPIADVARYARVGEHPARPVVRFRRGPADDRVMPHRTPDRTAAPAAHPRTPSATPAEPLWTIADVAGYARVGERTAWRLMRHPDAPARLKPGTRTTRWDPAETVSFLRRLAEAPRPTPAPADPSRVTVVRASTAAGAR